ncbi:jg1069, partial [Pararge aegeria aegeria]
ARYLFTPRGGKLLFYEGNTYFVNSSKRRDKSRVLWYCSSRKSRNCMASLLTLNDIVLGQPPVHTHPPKISNLFSTAALSDLTECAVLVHAQRWEASVLRGKHIFRELIEEARQV